MKTKSLKLTGNGAWLDSFFNVGFLCRSAQHAFGVKVAASRQGRVGSRNGIMTKDSVQIVPNSMTWVRSNSGFYYPLPACINVSPTCLKCIFFLFFFLLGNYCPICFKCYEDNDYDSQMMQCGTCNHWVHAKCEDLTGECFSLPCRVLVPKLASFNHQM